MRLKIKNGSSGRDLQDHGPDGGEDGAPSGQVAEDHMIR